MTRPVKVIYFDEAQYARLAVANAAMLIDMCRESRFALAKLDFTDHLKDPVSAVQFHCRDMDAEVHFSTVESLARLVYGYAVHAIQASPPRDVLNNMERMFITWALEGFQAWVSHFVGVQRSIYGQDWGQDDERLQADWTDCNEPLSRHLNP